MNSITIGQYIPGDSWLHKLDPRLKIALTLLWMVIIFLIPNLYLMLGMLALYFIMFFTTGLPFKRILKGVKPILFLLLFTFVLQLIYVKEGELIYSFTFNFGLYHLLIIIGLLALYFLVKRFIPFKLLFFLLIFISAFAIQIYRFDSFNWATYNFEIYTGGLEKGGFIFIRMLLMINITSLLTFSTMSIDINNGLQSLLSPLVYIKVPVGVIAMMFSLVLRFIPLLFDEANKILKAQASRGVEFSEGKLKDKITQIISLLIPMFAVSFDRAEDLANAMETRGYVVGAKRSRIDKLFFKWPDYVALSVSIMFFVGAILLNVL